jgi:ketosteroid isomerase-like protein
MFRGSAVLLVASIAGCGQPHRRLEPGTGVAQASHARSALLDAANGLASRMERAAFAESFSDVFADAGVFVNAGPLTARGPGSVRAWLARDTANARATARLTVLRHDVSADGNDGYTYGYFDVVTAGGEHRPGRYHAYWRRSRAREWQILAFTRGRRAAGPITRALPSSVRPATYGRSPAPEDSAAALRGLMHTERAFSDSAGTNVQSAFASFAAPDGAKIGAGSSYVFGRDAIAALFAGPIAGGGPLWTPEIGAVAASGDLGFTAGPVVLRRPADGAGAPAGAKYLTIWRRMPNGDWRYVVD